MRWIDKLRMRLLSLFSRSRVEADLNAELQFHIEQQAAENRQNGMDPDSARRAALRAFGGVAQVEEECRDRRRVRFADNLVRDIRFALRMFRRNPVFTAVALLTLGLGIGANAAIFSVIDGVLLRPLNFRESQRLYSIWELVPKFTDRFPLLPANPRHTQEWRQDCKSFEGFAEIRTDTMTLAGLGDPEQVLAAEVSWNYFDLLGVGPVYGRGFLREEGTPGRSREAVVSDALWRRKYSSDPSLVGRSIVLDGTSYIVIGIMPAGFSAPIVGWNDRATLQPDVFTPLALDLNSYGDIGDFDFGVIARLAPGVSAQSALADLDVAQSRITQRMDEKIELHAKMEPLKDSIVGQSRKGLLLLFGAVAAILLIVCVNLASLLLGKANLRARESAIRTALGATRGRLLSQTLTESIMLALTGGLAGIVLADWGLNVLLRLAPADLPRLDEIHLNLPVLLFAMGVSIFAGVLFGVLPAWRLARTAPSDALKAGGRTVVQAGNNRARQALVIAEVAVSVAMVAVAGLLLASFNRVSAANQSFQTSEVLTMDVQLPADKYTNPEDIDRFYTRALESIESLHGVASAGFVSKLPLSGDVWRDAVSVPGDNRPFPERPMAGYKFATPDYFKAVGITLIAGRAFDELDRKIRPAVISQATTNLWPGENPIGKIFRRSDPASESLIVVGVVRDVMTGDVQMTGDIQSSAPSRSNSMTVYVPYWLRLRPAASLAVRINGYDSLSATAAIRSAIWSIDNQAPVSNVRTLNQVVAGSLADRKFQLGVLILFAASALLLAALGVYGVVAESVSRRTNEIGIRMALGASKYQVLRITLREGMTWVLIGIGLGVALSLAIGRLLRGLLFGIGAGDPLTIGASALLLATVAFAGCYLPARRASRIDPMLALRYE